MILAPPFLSPWLTSYRFPKRAWLSNPLITHFLEAAVTLKGSPGSCRLRERYGVRSPGRSGLV